jgi:hypothetical protein
LKTILVALVVALTTSCNNNNKKAPESALDTSSSTPPNAVTVDDENWRENYAYTIGVQAYIFGFPYVNLPLIRWAWVTQEPKPGPNHDQTPYAAINHFFHFRNLTDATYRGGGGPNNDALYSPAWVDLSNEPVILSHPDLTGRFFIFQFASINGDNFAAVGTRATGSKPGNYAIIGPNWKGKLPSDVEALPRSPTNSVFILGRTLVKGPSDVKTVNQLQDRYKLTPLSYWGKEGVQLPEDHIAWQPFNAKTDSLADWRTMNKAMTEDPPEDRYSKLMILFSKVGIGPGQDVDKMDDKTKRGLARAARDGRDLITSINKGSNPNMGKKLNGWSLPPLTYGRLGELDEYLMRAVICQAGMIAPWIEDNWTTVTTTDNNDVLLDGSKNYTIHFAPGKLPNVKGFWSLTLYDNTDNLNPNPINRYSIGDRTDGIILDPDGGLTIYIQHNSPGKEKESNWLPSPESGKMRLAFRAYWPDVEVQKGLWNPPGIVEVK